MTLAVFFWQLFMDTLDILGDDVFITRVMSELTYVSGKHVKLEARISEHQAASKRKSFYDIVFPNIMIL